MDRCVDKTKWRRTHAGDGVIVADALGEQTVADLPCEDGRAFALVLGDFGHDVGGGDARLGAADGARFDRTRLVVPAVSKF